MRSCFLLFAATTIIFFASAGCSSKQDESGSGEQDSRKDTTNLTRVGDKVPSFSVITTEGKQISTINTEGKVLVLNFFATWCGPCMKELPHFESEVRRQFKDKRLVAICIGREHSLEELKQFEKEKGFELPMAPEPQRNIYKKFATRYIPRNYVVGKDGRIKYQSIGYGEEEFGRMIDVIQKELLNQIQ